MSIKPTALPWSLKTQKCDGVEYYEIVDANDKCIMDTASSEVAVIERDDDEDGPVQWDEQGRQNVKFALEKINLVNPKVTVFTKSTYFVLYVGDTYFRTLHPCSDYIQLLKLLPIDVEFIDLNSYDIEILSKWTPEDIKQMMVKKNIETKEHKIKSLKKQLQELQKELESETGQPT